MKNVCTIFVLLFIFSFQLNAQTTTHYVDADATGLNNGSSWGSAFTELQAALAVASANDEIWVAEGTYLPTLPSGRYVTFQLIANVSVYGGFAGTENSLSQRDYMLNKTILSGDIGVMDTPTDNAYHVVTGANNSTLDGFIIQDGQADGTYTDGGGMYNAIGSTINNLTIKNCTFKNNYATGKGMAMYNFMVTNLLIDNCTFTHNDFTFSSNTTVKGGAIYSEQGSFTIKNCYFDHNHSGADGGAIYNQNNTQVIIENTNFISNLSTNGNGGAIYSYLTTDIKNCVFAYNSANLNGGGVYAETANTVTNSTFFNNHANQMGGNFADNSFVGASTIANTILWNGNAGTGDGLDYRSLTGQSPNITYSCIKYDYTGAGNITGIGNIYYPADPKFVSVSDWHIQPGSSCIDVGNGDVAPLLDKDGNARFDDTSKPNSGVGTPAYVDMGAYENQVNSPLNGSFTIGSSGDYTSINDAVTDISTNGIDGAVIFTIASGIYNEQVVIPAITGASDTNTITFQSATGDSTDVVISYASSNTTQNYTVLLDGADYVSFKNLTLKATGTTYARLVELSNGAAFNSLENSILMGITNIDELIYAHSSSDDNLSNSFLNNVFKNGKIGIKYYGGSSTTGVTISFNEFNEQAEKALLIKNCKGLAITSNKIISTQPITAIHFDEMHTKAINIGNNIIKLPNGGNGIVFNPMAGTYSGVAEESLIYNNFIYINTSTNNYAIDFNNVRVNAKIFFNTIHITGNSTDAAPYHSAGLNSWNIDIKNNILVNETLGSVFSGGNYFGSDYNNLFANGEFIAFSAETIEEWQSNYNKGQHSIFANPYFISDTSWQVQNPLLNGAATPVAEVITDIEGDVRDVTNPDIGADEFTPTPVPLHGTYTIGGSSPDYTTINNAVEDLTINGVNAPVQFSIASGTYNEQVSIPEIVGASAINTVTFQSATGDSTDVLISYSPNTTHKYTIQLNGADYIILKNLSITTGELWGIPIQLKSEATHNQLNGNYIYKATQAPFSWDYALVYAKGSADSSNVFTSNYFENGNMGIYLDGVGSGTQITDNHFANLLFQGIYLKNNQSPIITGNSIEIATNLNFSYGIYLRGSTYNGSQTGIIANNMILINTSASGAIGIATPNASYLSVVYNTVKTNNGKAYQGGSNTTIINNIFTSSAGSFVAEISDTTGCLIDYNLYYNPVAGNADMYYTTGHTSNLEQYGFNLHSFSREPKFTSTNDLHTTDPWISNRGTPITNVTTDIDGEPRNATTPDVGADEYVADVLFAGDYTIGATGDFSTFTEAVDSIMQVGAIDSVTFYVASSIYNEQFTIGKIPFVSEDITVTFKPEIPGDSTVILQFAATASNNYIVRLDSTNYISLEGFTFKALDPIYSNVISLSGNTNHVEIKNNIMQSQGTESAVIYSSNNTNNDILIENNLILNGKLGIVMIGEDTGYETSNRIIHNTLINQTSFGIYVKYQNSEVIEQNIITHPNAIENTWIGITSSNCHYALIANNMVTFNATQQSAGIHLYNSTYQKIYFNSVHVYGDAPESRAFNQESGGSNNIVKNNIFSNTANGLIYYATELDAFISDYNNLYETGSRFAYYNGFINDITSWKNTSSKDSHSLNVNPLFYSATDLHTNQLVLVGNGASLPEVIIDIDGNSRNLLYPTIGAAELSYNCTSEMQGVHTIGANGTGEFGGFKEAILAMYSCGVSDSLTFVVSPGIYNEQIAINGNLINYPNGIKPVHFVSQTSSNDTHLQYAADSANNYTLKLDNVSKFSFNNLTIESLDSTYGRVIVFENIVDSVALTGNQIMGVESANISNLTACIFSDNKLNGDSTMHIIIANNSITNGSDGVFFKNNNSTYKGLFLTINGNTLTNQSNSSITAASKSILISDNVITSQAQYGMYLYARDSSIINSNKISMSSTNATGMFLYGSAVIYNNFISLKDGAYGISLSSANYGLYYNTILMQSNSAFSACVYAYTFEQIQILNNNFINLNADRILEIPSDNYTTVDADYNNIFSTSSYFNFDNFRAEVGGNTHSVSFMPEFISDIDLHTNAALLNGKGIPIVGVTTDIDGEPRDATNPDIGADEFFAPIFKAGSDTVFCYYNQYFNQQSFVYDIGAGYDSYQWSNGSDSSSIALNESAPTGSVDYTVTVNIGSTTYTDTVNIVYAKPVALSPSDYCFNEGESLTITAAPNESYLWNFGDTTQNITLTNFGSIPTVTVTDIFGCKSRETANINHNENPANFNFAIDTTICENTMLSIDANHYHQSNVYDKFEYVWSTGDTTNTILFEGKVFGAGAHKINVVVLNKTTSLGCTTSDTINIIVKPTTDVILSKNGAHLVANYLNGLNYDWYWNWSLLSSETNNSIIPTEDGTYFVQVVQENGCLVNSDTVSFTVLGINEATRYLFQVYPNPSNGHLTIHFNNPYNKAELLILSTNGKIIYQKHTHISDAFNEQQISLLGFPKGIYVLRILLDGHVYNQKLLIE